MLCLAEDCVVFFLESYQTYADRLAAELAAAKEELEAWNAS